MAVGCSARWEAQCFVGVAYVSWYNVPRKSYVRAQAVSKTHPTESEALIDASKIYGPVRIL
jgi:hypothetical protein